MIRWGVVGAGNIAGSFATDLATLPDTEITVVTSRSASSAQAFADRWGVHTVAPTLEAMLDRADIDAVYIAAPHTAHHAIAHAALDAGKPVLCEKPLVTNVADCEALLAHATDKQVLLTEALWSYFLPAWQRAIRWVQAGRIGAVHKLTVDFGFDMRPYSPNKRVYNRDLAGGCLLDMGIYPLALAWAVFQRLPASLHTSAGFAPNGVEDVFQSRLEYDDGAMALAGASFRTTLPNAAFIAGESGWIELPQFWAASECRLWRTDKLVDQFHDRRETIGLNFEIAAFMEDVRAGATQSTVMPHDSSLNLMRSMAQVRESFA
ncbi:MAG: Gfo/Idh/MocA family oxidoreductase [Pseudomonadota bacterium]